jgi:hypothetical protein
MLDIPSISAIAAAIGVLIGVVFTVLQLKDLITHYDKLDTGKTLMATLNMFHRIAT